MRAVLEDQRSVVSACCCAAASQVRMCFILNSIQIQPSFNVRVQTTNVWQLCTLRKQ